MLLFIAGLALVGSMILLSFVYFIFLLPPKYPTNIPAVPFWVALIPFVQDVDQSDIFRRHIEQPLRKHGAVKLFFGAQWNILVHRPSYLAEIFKDEERYQKSGNQKKIPHSVLAEFLGDNIISSHGEVWRNYRSVVRPGLQGSFDAEKITSNASRLCEILRDVQLQAGKGGIPVQEVLQRYSMANCSEVLLQMDLDILSSANVPLNVLQSAVKREIFKPIFMNFPILDRLPLPGRARARQMVRKFKNELRRALVESLRHNPLSTSATGFDGLGRRMLRARESGQWNDQQFLDNLTITFVAGQENPQLCMLSTLYLLAKHPDTQAELFAEIQQRSRDDPTTTTTATDLDTMPFLTSVIYESLRLFPPIGQLINRKASSHALLGDLVIPRGTYLGYNCYSTNRDPAVWGPDAEEFNPARWGDSLGAIRKEYRLRRARAEFITFHGGRRACLGERFAMLQVRITLVALVRGFTWGLDPTWIERMTPVSPSRHKDAACSRSRTSTPRIAHFITVQYPAGQGQRPFRAMDFSNEGHSFYHRFQGSFLYNGSGQLLHCTGERRQWVEENWTSLRSGDTQAMQQTGIKIYRSPHAVHNKTTAVMVSTDSKKSQDEPFEEFFVQRILSQADLCVLSHPKPTAQSDSTTEQIVDLFDRYLRYEGKNDRWAHGGRAYFAERVRHFTTQDAAIQFCLPAFPCKSSNGDKVTGPDPDRGEELALERLHGFVEAIERIYPPGAKLWIISDGHVFSDCIGVDDATVDAYGRKLKAMDRAIGLRRGNTDRIGFKSLVDLFQLTTSTSTSTSTVEPEEGGLTLSDLARRLGIPDIDHHVRTEVTEEAELCRRILMAGCAPRKAAVRAKIDSRDAAVTALYRGFSRFMLEDLEHHPHTRGMTRSQRKKLSAKVAFEMILMIFPNHVRLSIHAHNNAGPKFGIQLFNPATVRAVESLLPNRQLVASSSPDLLHIPTPWHNCVVQLDGSDVVLVTKAKFARAALLNNNNNDDDNDVNGGKIGMMSGGLRGNRVVDHHTAAAAVVVGNRNGAVVVDATESVSEAKPAPSIINVTVAVEEENLEKYNPVPGQIPSQATNCSMKQADTVLTAVVRWNTAGGGGGLPMSAAESSSSRPATWLGIGWLRRAMLTLFWPRGL
ncbi:Pyoverdine/dityrosine biosynthesis protein-domain-containing protein [Chaetomium strumarium]|uniref:Pyoverdine/dityrosine biosynthesis protein-domain-containing protein n=1 Tax=Chaetomium strumarium TaxID=1170767 RepID=A0AAJ0LXY7_9PEZI|nr:Pyoverdine/dityrosine biosynthesis protein-domain-containing protein [Chaetomium strumarium]